MKKSYEKPMLYMNHIAGEGVYLASGAASCRVECIYEGNPYDLHKQYKVTFLDLPESSGQYAQQADAVLGVQGGSVSEVVVQNGGSASLSGNTISIHLDSWSNWMQIQVTCDQLGVTVTAN